MIMCYLARSQCRRTKTVCDKPECLALWWQQEGRFRQEEVAKRPHVIDELLENKFNEMHLRYWIPDRFDA